VARIIVGGTIATAIFAALGVGIGTVVRNQVGAVITAIALMHVLEPLLTFIPGVGDAVQRFGLGGLSSGASGTPGFQSDVELLGQGPALLVLAAYALAAFLAGGLDEVTRCLGRQRSLSRARGSSWSRAFPRLRSWSCSPCARTTFATR
jgi:ABC-2 type transport system permease protein